MYYLELALKKGHNLEQVQGDLDLALSNLYDVANHFKNIPHEISVLISKVTSALEIVENEIEEDEQQKQYEQELQEQK